MYQPVIRSGLAISGQATSRVNPDASGSILSFLRAVMSRRTVVPPHIVEQGAPVRLLDALRQPLEDGSVTISRRGHSVLFPGQFQLVAATNPCPCGFEPALCGTKPHVGVGHLALPWGWSSSYIFPVTCLPNIAPTSIPYKRSNYGTKVAPKVVR